MDRNLPGKIVELNDDRSGRVHYGISGSFPFQSAAAPEGLENGMLVHFDLIEEGDEAFSGQEEATNITIDSAQQLS